MNKYKVVVLLIVVVLAINVIACGGSAPEITKDAQEAIDTAKAAQSSACATCMAFGTPCSECTGVCNCADLEKAGNESCQLAFGPGGNLENEGDLDKCLAQCETKYGEPKTEAKAE